MRSRAFKPNKKSAFTIIEILTAVALLSLVVTISISSFGFFNKKIPEMSSELTIHKSIQTANMLIDARLSQAVEIISPRPVKDSEQLIFKDKDGALVTLKIDKKSQTLMSFRENIAEKFDKGITPLNIRDIESAIFTALSPAALMIRIKAADKNKTGIGNESLLIIRLKNSTANL